MKKYIVEAYDSREDKWYEVSRHTEKRKAERVVEDLDFTWIKARIREG